MMFKSIKNVCRKAGPGIITGAADNDPSGIATYSQTGAQFGYAQLWTALFLLPFQTAIQESCARIGAVNGKGLAAVIKEHYGRKFLYVLISLVFFANTINIGADIGAMSAAVRLIFPINFSVLTLLFTTLILGLEIFISYKKYANLLKWLCLTLLAYPITVFIIAVPWHIILKATFVPHLSLNFQFLFIITGVLGTTISPYLFFWEASQEVEEEKCKHLLKKSCPPVISKNMLRRIQIDNFAGMLFSQLCAWSIIVVAATVLHPHDITDIKTAADAAKALEPFAGHLAEIIFAVGIIGLGLLSVPILAGSTAYAFSETFKWRWGLNLKFKSAPSFYGVILVSTLVGLLINFIGIDPMKALVYAAVVNGIVAVPLIFIIALIANNKKIMKKHTSGLVSNILVWMTFLGMALTAVTLFVLLFT